jgi:hypothetical protein
MTSIGRIRCARISPSCGATRASSASTSSRSRGPISPITSPRSSARCPAPRALDRLYERSEGNPFFTEELLTAAGSGELPASLRDAMALQLERLPPAAQRVVRVLAAAGRRVDHRLLERAAATEADELSASTRRCGSRG